MSKHNKKEKYTKAQLKAFEKDAEPIESSATDPKFLTSSPENWEKELFIEANVGNGKLRASWVEHFVKKLLSSQREEMLKEIESKWISCGNVKKCVCCSIVKSLLTELKNK